MKMHPGFLMTLLLLGLPAHAQVVPVCPTGTAQQLILTGGGLACAIQPSQINAATLDNNGTPKGYGFHVLVLPPGTPQRTLVYLGGTGNRPFNQNTSKFQNINWLTEVANSNTVGFFVAYDNSETVATLCKNNADCYGSLRQEQVYGTNASQVVAINTSNAVEFRTQSLTSWVKAKLPTYPWPTELNPLNWSALTLGGHSNGGGAAGYLAKGKFINRVCYFAAPVDTYKVNGRDNSANWIDDTAQTQLTAQRGIIHFADPNVQEVEVNYATIKLPKSTSESQPNGQYVVSLISYPADPHTGIAFNTAFTSLRNWACLAP